MNHSLTLFSLVAVLSVGCASAQSAGKPSYAGAVTDREPASSQIGDQVGRHYLQIADLLSQVRIGTGGGEDICSTDAYQQTILAALGNASDYVGDAIGTQISPNVQKALDGVLGFKAIVQNQRGMVAGDWIQKNLPGTHWEDNGHGAYGHAEELNFRDGGQVTVRSRRWLNENADSPTWLTFEGTWKLAYHKKDTTKSNVHVAVTYKSGKGQSKTVVYEVETKFDGGTVYYVLTSGSKKSEGGNGDGRKVRYYDHVVDECDA